MNPLISVIIPTHNPRLDFMTRVLEALRNQTLPTNSWELYFVDNASKEKLSEIYDLRWHPNAEHIGEEKLGLTSARLAGIARCRADIVVMVDDDNVLYPNYLETTLRLADEYPFVGIWGGQVFAEFEDPENFYAKNFPTHFTARAFSQDLWTNRKRDYAVMPIGAGLCARRSVLDKYAEICAADPRRKILDRTGERLLTCGDLDIVFTACDAGYGKALFHELKLTHLIPKKRLCEEFVVGNCEGNQYSATIQNFLTEDSLPDFSRTVFQQVGRVYRLMRQDSLARKMALAEERGQRQAINDMARWGWIQNGKSE
jgi:glycosyltransferase involved in cell wall biosynthesis